MHPLTHFFNRIREDNRITTSHISIYMALFERWQALGFASPVSFTRSDLMEQSKISGLATYHKCIRDLVLFGYIDYQPSYNASVGSKAYLKL